MNTASKAITVDDVHAYRLVHFPQQVALLYKPGRPVPVPGDAYVAALSHERFHEWFGTTCDATCPHAVMPLPRARVLRRTCWRRFVDWMVGR